MSRTSAPKEAERLIERFDCEHDDSAFGKPRNRGASRICPRICPDLIEDEHSFERFESFLKQVLAVPKNEITELERKRRIRKP